MTTRRWTSAFLLSSFLGVLGADGASAATFTVSPGGSIGAALAAAAAGDSVLVEAGTYFEHLTLVDGVKLLGGYDSSFSEGTRDRGRNRTIVHGSDTGIPVTSGPGISSDTLVEGFVISGGSGDGAAGVRIRGGAPVFADNEISSNRGGVAGGVYISDGSTAKLLGNLIGSNASAGSGGGVRVEQSAATLIGNDLRDNDAPHNGGGLYVFESAVYCSSNAFKNCVSREGGGGGAYLQRVPSNARFVDNFYFYCSAPTGGGMYAKDESYPVLEREEFRDCRATENGGGLASSVFSEVTVTNCRFDNCRADGNGGGIYALDGDLHLMGSSPTLGSPTTDIRGCTAVDFGGGVYVATSTGLITGVHVAECRADQWGGGLYILHSEMLITRNVIESCVASEGGGMAIRTETLNLGALSTVLNNDVWGCSGTGSDSPAVGGGITLAGGGTDNMANLAGNIVGGTLLGGAIRCRRGGGATGAGSPAINCSSFHADPSNPVSAADVVGGSRCDTAFSSDPSNKEGIDPQFCSPSGSDFRLESTSPNVGTNCPNGGGKVDRGAHTDGDHCPGAITSVENASWGQIKAMYR